MSTSFRYVSSVFVPLPSMYYHISHSITYGTAGYTHLMRELFPISYSPMQQQQSASVMLKERQEHINSLEAKLKSDREGSKVRDIPCLCLGNLGNAGWMIYGLADDELKLIIPNIPYLPL